MRIYGGECAAAVENRITPIKSVGGRRENKRELLIRYKYERV
jgi:hypothetical protein